MPHRLQSVACVPQSVVQLYGLHGPWRCCESARQKPQRRPRRGYRPHPCHATSRDSLGERICWKGALQNAGWGRPFSTPICRRLDRLRALVGQGSVFQSTAHAGQLDAQKGTLRNWSTRMPWGEPVPHVETQRAALMYRPATHANSLGGSSASRTDACQWGRTRLSYSAPECQQYAVSDHADLQCR